MRIKGTQGRLDLKGNREIGLAMLWTATDGGLISIQAGRDACGGRVRAQSGHDGRNAGCRDQLPELRQSRKSQISWRSFPPPSTALRKPARRLAAHRGTCLSK